MIPTLTDEELAEIERWDRLRGKRVKGVAADCRLLIAALRATRAPKPPPTVYDVAGMLVEIVETQRAALRAKSAEVERLKSLAHSNRVEADAMGEIAREWEAEVERLKHHR
jgi:hypothetical protein